MASTVSRTALSRWATDVCGVSMAKSQPLEKQCSNGVIYCQLLDAVRPGSLNLTKVNMEADADHKAIQNFKLLEVALEKAGIMQELNLPQLTKGQPQAHLELMQKLYALAPPDAPAPAKGLRPLDANTLDSSGVRKGKAQAAAMNVRSAKRPAEEMATAEAADAEHDREAAPSSATLSEMQSEIDRLQTELLLSQTESTQLRDEADFYIKKLELIEDACVMKPTAEVQATVLKLLHADEEALTQSMSAVAV